jgi:hypothetical protein
MAHGIEVTYFRSRLALLARGLRSRYAELTYRDFPSDTPGQLITLIISSLDKLIEKIETADEKFLQIFFQLVTVYQGYLAHFDNAHKEQTPRGLIVVLEGLLARVSPSAQFFAAPQFDYNYGIATFKPVDILALGNYLSAQEKAELPAIVNSTIHLIMFPRAERDNILIHAVFGHEVGHLVAADYLSALQSTPEFLDAVKTAVEEILKVRPAPQGANQIQLLKHVSPIATALQTVWRRAMEELISDYVGCLLFGPSALFASYEIFALQDLDAAPSGDELYPPGRLRFRLLIETLAEEGFLASIEKLTESSAGGDASRFFESNQLIGKIKTLTAATDDTSVLNQDVIHQTAYAWVQKSLSAAKPKIKSLVPMDLMYKVGEFDKEVPHLLDRLELNVPPNELDVYPNIQSPSWQSALNASWIFKLYGKKAVQKGAEEFSHEDYEAINRLCLLAIENIALQREYKAHMTKPAEKT